MNVQEIFSRVIALGYYTSAMCNSLDSALDLDDVDEDEYQFAREQIDNYLMPTDCVYLQEALEKAGLPHTIEDRLAIYLDWANRPSLLSITKDKTMTDTARDQAITQMQYIEDLLGALRMDWEFLGDLQDHCEDEDLATLQELTEQAAGCSDADEALERLEENPLEVQFRSDWESCKDDLTPSEFAILLCTGGPAVRIRGELDHNGYPSRAWVEYQSWGTPWAELCLYQSTALDYAQLLIPC